MPQIEADFKERYNQGFIPNKTEHFKCSECSNESKCVYTCVCLGECMDVCMDREKERGAIRC